MELLDAIEEFERVPGPRSSSLHDFVERQVLRVQQQLRELWLRKHGGQQNPPIIPFYWVFAKLLRLVEAYPDGLTEAVVVTELTALLKQRESQDNEQADGKSRKRRRVRDEEEMAELLEECEQEALLAKVVGYENHRLKIELEKVKDETAIMYLHQRFRSCVSFLHSQMEYEPNSAAIFPFQGGRLISFTNAKLLERKDVDTGRTNDRSRVKFTLLPTAFLTARLDEKRPLDRRLLADSVSLSRVDQLVATQQHPAVIQHLMIKARVLDIGAIRPCQTPLYVYRQVILLGEVGSGTTANTQRMMQASHVMVLWDDQVALSRLFRVGDTVTLFHPFVHVCEPTDSEIIHIMNEYSSQQRCAYYFEYGSATVLFCQSSRAPDASNTIEASPTHHSLVTEQERPFTRLEEIRPGWHNFSLYAHVRSIKVSHGIPLLAAFFYAYYDPKTNQSQTANGMMQAPPALDLTIVSKFYLVVLLQVYIASSSQLLTIEVTGANAVTALRLRPGQSIFFDGLAAVDARTGPVRKFREPGCMVSPSLAVPTSQAVEFAFPTSAYTSSMSSGVVALCSDWDSIFGKQSLFSNSSKLMVVNTTPGLMNTALDREELSAISQVVSKHAIGIVEMTVAAAGWLIPDGTKAMPVFTLDTTCGRGHFTMYAHKLCRRPLEVVQNQHTTSGPTKWKCEFCREMFFGTEDTVQTFCDLLVTLEDGRSRAAPLTVLCQGNTAERLLGVTAEDYPQLRIAERREALERVVGNAFRVVVSRCEPLSVSMVASSRDRTTESKATINLRMDLVQPVDTFAMAHQLLAALKQTRR